MLVTFEGKFSKKREDLICDLVTFAQDQMFPDQDDVYLNIEALRRDDGYCGDVMYEDENEFTIRLNKLLSTSKLAITVLHEMVHVSQYLKGMLMDTESEYHDRWQEKEAHKLEKVLWDTYKLEKILGLS